MSKFTEKAERALEFARESAEKFGHTYIGSEHILYALSSDEHTLSAVVLARAGISASRIETLIIELCGKGAKSKLGADELTPSAKRIIEGAYAVARKYDSKKTGTEHLLAALLEERESVAGKMLIALDTDVFSLKDEVLTLLRASDSKIPKSSEKSKHPSLTKFGKNLTSLADGFDPLIGRDAEIDRLIRVLTRKNKNNPCLVGEAGVGKTAIVEGLAARIAKRDVPPSLYGKEIISVDLTSMIAGAKYRGDFEERIIAITEEAASDKNIILFIDEIHTIVGAGAAEGAIDAANILKPKLARAEIQLIGATTFSEYRKYIEKDSALERRFQPIEVREPTTEGTVEILRGIKKSYEEHHGIVIEDNALVAAAELSARYINDRHMPDKAIDLLDEASAKCALEFKVINEDVKNIDEKIRQIQADKEDAVSNLDFELAVGLRDLELLYKAELRRICDTDKREASKPHLSESMIKTVVSEIVGAEIKGDANELFHLGERLRSEVLGQNEAISILTEAIIRNRIDIGAKDRPLGIFMFVGESGVGKTALAEALAKELFGDKRFLIRYDMSEFSEQSSVAKFIGSAPGYVGYDDGSSVLERVRRMPYSVVLFDEIEKASGEVRNLFLQIADYGKITDSHGREISFKNTYIILTSNAPSKSGIKEIGFSTSSENKAGYKSLTDLFTTEFIGRIDEIICFSSLSLTALKEITEKIISELSKRLNRFGVEIAVESDAIDFIARKGLLSGGVRNILSFVKQNIENKAAIMISKNECEREDLIKVSLKDQSVINKVIKKSFK